MKRWMSSRSTGRSKGLAPRTIQTYLFALEGLSRFLSVESVRPQIPSFHELRSYVSDMLERGLARGTIRIRMRSVRVFCNFLERESLVQVNPM